MAENKETLCGLFALPENTKLPGFRGYPENRLKINKVKYCGR